MKLKFIKPSDLSGNIKATIQKSGKLGFNADAAKKLKLDPTKYAKLAINSADSNDKNLYMILCKDATESYKVSRAGDYYYINLKYFFDDLGIDYEKDAGQSYKIKNADFNEGPDEQAYILEIQKKESSDS